MGLDTTHDCWHGPYSSFGRWRQELAKAAGMPPLCLMAGYFNAKEWWLRQGSNMYRFDEELAKKSYPGIPGMDMMNGGGLSTAVRDALEGLPISWELFEADPLVVLLNHSDADGLIPAALCCGLANRLEQLIPRLPQEDNDYLCDKTQKFIAGLRRAAEANEDVRFH